MKGLEEAMLRLYGVHTDCHPLERLAPLKINALASINTLLDM